MVSIFFSYFFSLLRYFFFFVNYTKVISNKQSEDLKRKSGAGRCQQLRQEKLYAQGISRDSRAVHFPAVHFVNGEY